MTPQRLKRLNPMPNPHEWQGKTCPICGQFYRYQPAHHTPVTCGRYSCIQEATKQGLLPKGENRDIQ